MDRLIEIQMANIEKAYDSIPMGGKLEFSKSAIEGIHQVLRELKEYKDLEEQGRLVKLPCKLKDIVWQIVKCSDNVYRIFEMKVCSLREYGSIYNSKEPFLWNAYLEDKSGFGYSYATFYDFGKSVFLNSEEAELKLMEMENKQ